MLIQPDCIPCILKMALSAIRGLCLDKDTAKDLYCRILKLPHLRGYHWDITSEEVIELVLKLILDTIDHPDPFNNVKLDQNKMIMNIYPGLQKLVANDSDPLYVAVKLAILGNALDVMVSDKTLDLENSIAHRLNIPLSKEIFSRFNEKLKASKFVLYFGDNAGEIVFDKLLIETIKNIYDLNIVVVVRSHPILNDATLEEARFVGLDKIVPVMENGIDGPLPGTILRRCSDEVQELVRQADLIIAKGGANFDTFEEEYKHMKMNITFLFLAKCFPYYNQFHKELNQPIIANYYSKPAGQDR